MSLIFNEILWLLILISCSFITSKENEESYGSYKYDKLDGYDDEDEDLKSSSYDNDDHSLFGVVPELLSGLKEGKFRYEREHSSKLSQIYSKYLKNDYYIEKCSQESDSHANEDSDFESAFRVANIQIKEYENANQEYLSQDPRGLNFSAYLYVATLHSKYNEFVTDFISKTKCYDKYKTAKVLPSVEIPPNIWNNKKYCDLESPDNPHINCNPKDRYRRNDGKCNHPEHENWGSSFHCHRRLLPPDYADGIEIPRKASDGTELPNPRLLTEVLMPDLKLDDKKRTSMHMIWGQFLVHDTYKTLQYLGLAIRCCPLAKNPPPAHPECLAIDNIPPDEASIRRNTRCISSVRSTACNTCSLGPRNQMNAATPLLDLSNIYGGNLMNISFGLRTLTEGRLRMSVDREGNDILPVAQLPRDQDTSDLVVCNPPLDRPWLTCFQNGDGIRGNQNPMVNTLHITMNRRHNQHSVALSGVNPHWDDEKLYQEARRILIAEYNKINFGEYLPSLLGKNVMDYFDLDVKDHGFTKYNPKLDPATLQSVGVAAMRMGHSQVQSLFSIISKSKADSSSFNLRDKFFEMSDIFDGNHDGILNGLLNDPDRNVDPFVTTDLKDFLFFNPRTPTLADLPAININRGRDHGVPAYIYHLEYCTGARIHGWKDLHQFIPSTTIKRLKSVYKNYKDIDLFVGGLSETHFKGSILGPTFTCLNAIQFYHWKYGDRYYFEHGREAGSFTADQLNNIRQTASLANLLCKTSELDSIQPNTMFTPSESNPKRPCHTFPDIDYELWRDIEYFKK